MTLKVGSLFAGYGGLSLAVEEVFGAELAWYADCCKFDKQGNASHHTPCRAPCSIMAHHWPDIPNLGDVTKVDWANVPPIDILDGGSPCQDLSHAGKRAGMTEGTRSNLWVAMREAIAQLRPRYVVWENVRGAYSAEADSELDTLTGLLDPPRRRHGEPVLRALGRVLGDLSDLGYDCRWHGLRAADVGAPHGRFRVFVIASDARRSHEYGWKNPISRRSILPTPTTRDHKGHNQRRDETCLTGALALLPTPRSSDGTHGGPNQAGSSGDLMLPSAIIQRWGDYAAAIARWEIILGRPAPQPTQTSSKGNPQLSARFVEFLMGVADGWVTDVSGITRNEALKALGNGVVTQQAIAALRTMLAWEATA